MAIFTHENHPLNRYVGQAVDVHFGGDVLPGTLTRVVSRPEGRDLKVVFDDPLVYGGMGAGWFTAQEVSHPGQAGGLDG